MAAQYMATSGLIVTNCKMNFRKDTEDFFQIDGSNIMLNFRLNGSRSFEVDQLTPLRTTGPTDHSILYTPNFKGRYLLSADQEIHYICIILSEDFYFNLISRESNLHKDFVDNVYHKKHTYFAPGPQQLTPRVQCILSELTTINAHTELSRLLLETKIKEVLIAQLEQLLARKQPPAKRPLLSPTDAAKVYQAKEILDEQFINPPAIPALARLVMLNEYKLKTGFKACYEQTIYRYVIDKKMKLALSLLKGGMHTVGEVAYKTGYQDISHFSNAFLKYYGYRPTTITQSTNNEPLTKQISS